MNDDIRLKPLLNRCGNHLESGIDIHFTLFMFRVRVRGGVRVRSGVRVRVSSEVRVRG